MTPRLPFRSARSFRSPFGPVVALMLGALSGCSHVHVDAAGQRHIVGFVVLTLPPVDPAALGAETIRSRSIGLAFTRSPVGDAFVLGYSDASLTAVRNHSLVPAPGASPTALSSPP